MEILQEKFSGLDQDVLLSKLLLGEVPFLTVEADSLPSLKARPWEGGRVYILGKSNFLQPPLSEGMVVKSLTPKALVIAGDDNLSTVAREALPDNVRTSKKAMELMGSTKVVTEKKALKRLGSEMTEDMRVLQIKTERREMKKEEEVERRREKEALTNSGNEGGGGSGGGNITSGGSSTSMLRTKRSLANIRPNLPSFTNASPTSRRATQLGKNAQPDPLVADKQT